MVIFDGQLMNQIEYHRYQHVKGYYDEQHFVARRKQKKMNILIRKSICFFFRTGLEIILSKLLLFDVIV